MHKNNGVVIAALLLALSGASVALASELSGLEDVLFERLFSPTVILPIDYTLETLERLGDLYARDKERAHSDWAILLRQFADASHVSADKCAKGTDKMMDLAILLELDIKSRGSQTLQEYIEHYANEQWRMCAPKLDADFERAVSSLGSKTQKWATHLLHSVVLASSNAGHPASDSSGQLSRDAIEQALKVSDGVLGEALAAYLHDRTALKTKLSCGLNTMLRDKAKWLESKYDKHVRELCVQVRGTLNKLTELYEPFLAPQMAAASNGMARQWAATTRICSRILTNRNAVFMATQIAVNSNKQCGSH